MEREEKIRYFREKIAPLDEQILCLLNKRAEIALEIGKVKSQGGIALYDPHREDRILKQLVLHWITKLPYISSILTRSSDVRCSKSSSKLLKNILKNLNYLLHVLNRYILGS